MGKGSSIKAEKSNQPKVLRRTEEEREINLFDREKCVPCCCVFNFHPQKQHITSIFFGIGKVPLYFLKNKNTSNASIYLSRLFLGHFFKMNTPKENMGAELSLFNYVIIICHLCLI